MVASVNPVVAQAQTSTRNLPVPMSHYRQQIIKPPAGFLENILEKETGVSNRFPGINTEALMADCFEKLSPEQQAIVRETVGEENIPKRPVETRKPATEVPKPAAETSKLAAKAAETAAETATNAAKKAGKEASKGKWGWVAAGVGVVAAGIGGKYYLDKLANKRAEQQQLNLSA